MSALSGGHGSHGSRSELDDRSLMQAHIDGDPSAFAELVRRHKDRLWAVAMRTLADREEASDALQDALISAFRNAASYRGEAAVTTWLHRVVVNACLDRVRRRRARPSVPLGDTEVSSSRDDNAAVEARLMVYAALAQLPEPQRMAIILVDLQELSVSEAAAALGVAEGTIKSRCSRGRTELARLLGAGPVAGAPPSVDLRAGAPPSVDLRAGESLAAQPVGGTSSRTARNPGVAARVPPPESRAAGSPGPTTSGG
jgi:RNA polymerase sigma-70 factor, ECF subfamily